MKKPANPLGLRIRALRKKHGMTQQELANAIGCIVSNVQHIEGGRSHGSVPLLERIAKVFRVDVGTLLRGRKAGAKP